MASTVSAGLDASHAIQSAPDVGSSSIFSGILGGEKCVAVHLSWQHHTKVLILSSVAHISKLALG